MVYSKTGRNVLVRIFERYGLGLIKRLVSSFFGKKKIAIYCHWKRSETRCQDTVEIYCEYSIKVSQVRNPSEAKSVVSP